uniref:Glutaminase n=2 Tax=Parascaris univalens TaxID=6257 RepID=A0A915A3J7_PARUN
MMNAQCYILQPQKILRTVMGGPHLMTRNNSVGRNALSCSARHIRAASEGQQWLWDTLQTAALPTKTVIHRKMRFHPSEKAHLRPISMVQDRKAGMHHPHKQVYHQPLPSHSPKAQFYPFIRAKTSIRLSPCPAQLCWRRNLTNDQPNYESRANGRDGTWTVISSQRCL